MVRVIEEPKCFQDNGYPPILIEEFIGRLNSATSTVSVARLVSQCGWREPGQTPDFDEFTVVLRGTLHVETKEGAFRINAGQAVIAEKGEWVRYSTPDAAGAEYVAICLPAFSFEAAHRDALP